MTDDQLWFKKSFNLQMEEIYGEVDNIITNGIREKILQDQTMKE